VRLTADKLKSCLPEEALNCVLSLEGRDCFGPGKIAELADTYVSHHGEKDKPRCTAHVAQVKGSAEDRSPRTGLRQGRFEYPEDGGRDSLPPRDIICFSCNERGHAARFCPRKGTTESRSAEQRPSDGVHRCYRCNSSRHLVKDCPSQVNKLHVNANCDLEEEEAQVNV